VEEKAVYGNVYNKLTALISLADSMSSPPSSSRKRKQQSIPSNSTFIWAKDGNTLHPAYLLSSPPYVGASNSCNGIDVGLDNGIDDCTNDTNNSSDKGGERDEEGVEYVWVQWTSNGTTSHIPKANISTDLPSRRSSRRASSSMNSSATTTDVEDSGSRDTSVDKDDDDEYVDNKPKTATTKSKRKSKLSLTKKQRLQFKEHHNTKQKRKVKHNTRQNDKGSIDIKSNETRRQQSGMKRSPSDISQPTSSSKSTTAKKVHPSKQQQQQNNKEDNDIKLAIQMSLQSYNNNNNGKISSAAMGVDQSSSNNKKQKYIHNEIIDIVDSDDDIEEKKDEDTIGMSSSADLKESNLKQGGLKSARVSLSPDVKSKQSVETNPKKSQCWSQPEQQKSKAQVSIPTTTTAQSLSNNSTTYTHRSSAYIQHIAEATTLIMTDARWHTTETITTTVVEGETQQHKSLFMWEKGDDLSAVKTFMSLYDDDEKTPQAGEEAEDKGDAKEPELGGKSDDAKEEEKPQDEVFERAMHLYSRMFIRKGPYFDLADLYTRYYAPKSSTKEAEEQEEEISPRESQDSVTSMDESQDSVTSKASIKAKGFFKPRLSIGKGNSSKITLRSDLIPHQTAIEHLFQDILRLLSMGLIRTFESEYECGYVVGNVNRGGYSRRGTLLSSNERRDILNKLGGGKSTKAPVRTSLGKKSTSSTNEILNQMQNQPSLLSSFAKSSKASVGGGKANKPPLLPVIKHVDKLLLNKLAAKVASLVSNSQPRKTEIEEATRMIQKAWSAAYTLYKDDDRACMTKVSSNCITTTFRLREAPLKTLRRCLRLFLCAGGGPGAMRGDGSNGWISVLDDGVNDPCSLTSKWHTVTYPGLSSRFGLECYELSRYYTAIPMNKKVDSISTIGPFSHYCQFQLWEIGVELRSFVDQVNERYEIQKQTLRRRERDLSKSESQESSRSEEVMQSNDDCHAPINLLNRDGYTLLTEDGRKDLVKSLMTPCFIEGQMSRYTTFGRAVINLCQQIEIDILSLSHNVTSDDDDDDDNDGFISDTERVIAATAIICHRILQLRIKHPSLMLTSLTKRPWLRHMNFDAILAYIIWDIIPIYERRGHHLMAVSMLQTILFGQEFCSFDKITGELLLESSTNLESLQVKPFVECLLPRRNRGKAYERLVIDITHVERRAKKETSNQQPRKKKAKKSNKDKNDEEEEKSSPLQSLCTSLLRSTEVSGSIPFFSMRNLARRSKQALPQTNERSLLSIRPGDSDNNWSPSTDNAVANSISSSDNSDSAAGKRCSFVGWELDDDVGLGTRRSLNVEELAMEQYHHGLLPNEDNIIKGQWVGWHNEGSHVRALFRILCLPHLLEPSTNEDELYQDEQTTIIMTPYQFSPHDLHVGCVKANSPTVRGFYERRRSAIETFLSQLLKLDEDGISNLIYTSIKKRWDRHIDDQSRSKDPRLIKDVKELNTLSMIGCALNGAALASIFRTLCFDYRSWSGGLPDLFLVRAQDSSPDSSSFVSLADWIGEGFSQEAIDAKNMKSLISLLAERDDEFLGQLKNADGFSSQLFTSKKKKKGVARVEVPPFPQDKLKFMHDEKQVKAECMFVEVKSANDRLSERQEDWLSILEGCTNARVCKFSSSK